MESLGELPRELHSAKCEVLAKFANDLRHTINGDLENLRFQLCVADLISLTTRDSKDAGKMVSEVQYRLQANEMVWEGLITLLRECKKEALHSNLEEQLRRKTEDRQGCVHAVGKRAGKFGR